VDWYNHQHRLLGDSNLQKASRSIRCWKQPELVWINPPADDFIAETAKFALAA